MSASGRRIAALVLALPAVAAIAFGLLLLSDHLREPDPVPSTPVPRPSAIDSWRPAADAGGPAPASEGTALPTRWLVVGWDGADWDELLPMIDAGRLPNLARLMRSGACGALLTFKPTLSPVLWTTVATGEPPERHGILGFEKHKSRAARRIERVTHLGGMRRELFTNTDRRAPALWNLISDRGGTVLVAGYHNTFPAERVNGLMVSNYLMQDYKAETLGADGGSASRSLERMLYPAALADGVLPIELAVRKRFPEETARFADLATASLRRLAAAGPPLDPVADRLLYFLRDAYVFDTFDAEVAARWIPKLRPDVAFVHFQALDLCSHYDLYFHNPAEYAGVPLDAGCRERLDAEAPEFRKTLGAFASYLDEWLGRLIDLSPPGTAVMVLSDHGFDPIPDCREPGGHDEAPPGILVMSGPGIHAGVRVREATLYDVFPTLAASLGLPLASDLPGRPLFAAFEPGLLDPRTVRTVPSYAGTTGFRPAAPEAGQPDPEVLLRLKSLGYVK